MSNITNFQSNISLLELQYRKPTIGVNDLPDKARVGVLVVYVQ